MPDPEAPAPRAIARSLPRWVALPAAAGLIAIVALASRSTSFVPATGGFDAGAAALTAIEVVGYVALAVGLGVLVPAIAMFRPDQRRRRSGGQLTKWELPPIPLWARALGLGVTLAVIAGQVAVMLAILAELRRTAEDGANAASGLDPNALWNADRGLMSLTIALVIVTALVVVLLALAVRWRLRDDRLLVAGGGDLDGPTAQAVEVSLDALRREPDPRRAVIAAYAAMERSLSGAGLGRRRSEAPLEYLRRVLAGATSASDEVQTITYLFQFAKFSPHAVDETMRSGAIQALERIRATSKPG